METVAYLGIKMWKILPSDYKELTCLSMFKSKVKSWVTDECTCWLWKVYNVYPAFFDWANKIGFNMEI